MKSVELLFFSVPRIPIFQMTCLSAHWFFSLLVQVYSWTSRVKFLFSHFVHIIAFLIYFSSLILSYFSSLSMFTTILWKSLSSKSEAYISSGAVSANLFFSFEKVTFSFFWMLCYGWKLCVWTVTLQACNLVWMIFTN